jgi:hypothetical protein
MAIKGRKKKFKSDRNRKNTAIAGAIPKARSDMKIIKDLKPRKKETI